MLLLLRHTLPHGQLQTWSRMRWCIAKISYAVAGCKIFWTTEGAAYSNREAGMMPYPMAAPESTCMGQTHPCAAVQRRHGRIGQTSWRRAARSLLTSSSLSRMALAWLRSRSSVCLCSAAAAARCATW